VPPAIPASLSFDSWFDSVSYELKPGQAIHISQSLMVSGQGIEVLNLCIKEDALCVQHEDISEFPQLIALLVPSKAALASGMIRVFNVSASSKALERTA